jgi:hypothetical protein
MAGFMPAISFRLVIPGLRPWRVEDAGKRAYGRAQE